MMNYIGLIASILPIVLHCIGFLLLYYKGNNITTCQRIYLLNLSVSEIFICVSSDIYLITYYRDNGSDATKVMQCFYYCSVLPFYLIMIALTADRYFELYLNIRLHLYWSTESAKTLMLVTWLLTLCVFLLVVILLLFDVISSKVLTKAFFLYVYPICSVTVFIVVLTSYVYIITVLKRSQLYNSVLRSAPQQQHRPQPYNTVPSCSASPQSCRAQAYNTVPCSASPQSCRSQPHNTVSCNASPQSHRSQTYISVPNFASPEPRNINHMYSTERNKTKGKFRKNQHLILPTLLIVTYIVFIMIPDIISYFVNIDPQFYAKFFVPIYRLGFATDAIIYILLSTPARRYIVKWMCCKGRNYEEVML